MRNKKDNMVRRSLPGLTLSANFVLLGEDVSPTYLSGDPQVTVANSVSFTASRPAFRNIIVEQKRDSQHVTIPL